MNNLTLAHLSAGVSAGLLLGVIMGLSFSPVVGSFIGLIAPVAIAWMTFRNNKREVEKSKDETLQPGYPLKIAVFCFAALLGTTAGIWLRTHNTLGVSFEDEIRSKVDAWKDIGFTDKSARILVASAYMRDGPKGSSPSSATGLFEVISNPDRNIEYLDPSRYPNTTETIRAYRAHGGPSKAIADVIKNLSEDQKKLLTDSIWELVKDNSQ